MDNYNFKKLSSSSILVKNGNKTVVLSGRYTAEYRDKSNNDILVIKNKYDNEILESIDVSVDNISIDDVGKSYNEAEELYLELDSLGIFFLDSSSTGNLEYQDYPISQTAWSGNTDYESTVTFTGAALGDTFAVGVSEGVEVNLDNAGAVSYSNAYATAANTVKIRGRISSYINIPAGSIIRLIKLV